MNKKSLILLAGVACILVSIAMMLRHHSARKAAPGPTSQSGSASTGTAKALLFEQASTRAGDVARVTIRKGDQQVDIARSPDGTHWVVASRDGYPAVDDNIRKIVRGVLDAEIIEKKTSDPELFSRLDVQDVSSADAKSSQLTLADASGTAIADLIVGKRQETANWDFNKTGTFVRPAGQNQSYLVRGTFDLPAQQVDWMKRIVTDFAPEVFHTVTIQSPNQPPLTIRKTERSTPGVLIENMPAGREVAQPGQDAQVLSAIANISLDDVRKAEGFDLAGPIVATFTTFDGVVLTARTVKRDNDFWIALIAAYDAKAVVPRTDKDPPVPADNAAQVEQQAKDLQQRLAPWVFKVPEDKGTELTMTMDGLLKPLGEPANLPMPGQSGSSLVPPQ
jgi:hypothetical protein